MCCQHNHDSGMNWFQRWCWWTMSGKISRMHPEPLCDIVHWHEWGLFVTVWSHLYRPCPPKTKNTQDEGFLGVYSLQKGIWPRWNSEMNLLDGSKFWDGTTGTRQPLILHVWLGHCGDEWWRFSPIRYSPTSKEFSCLKFIKAQLHRTTATTPSI